MNQNASSFRDLAIPIVIVLALLVAVFFGLQIGSNELNLLLLTSGALALLAHVLYFSRFTWQIALLFCYLGLSYRPWGFQFSGAHLSYALGALLAGITFWQKRPAERTGILEHRIFGLLRLCLMVWLAYVAIHMFYNIKAPYRPADFALKNALKSYAGALGPPALLWYFSAKPTAIRTHGNLVRVVAILMLAGLVFNIAFAVYALAFNPYLLGAQDGGSEEVVHYLIPVINAAPGPYILRYLGPSAVLLGAIGLSLGPRKAGISRLLSTALVLFGFLGAGLSAGRAALITAVLYVGIMLVLRKQIPALLMMWIVSGFFVIAVNLFSDWINREAPLAVTRPLQLIMVERQTAAFRTIESSSRWRGELFRLALTEWRSDPRIFWFGRATYGFGVSDFVAQQLQGVYEAKKVSALRRGTTHNLLTDLLVAYGLVGCILYYALLIAIIRLFWVIHRTRDLPAGVMALSLMGLIYSATYVILASVAGGLVSVEVIWILIVVVAALYQHRPAKMAEERVMASPILPKESRRIRPRAIPARP